MRDAREPIRWSRREALSVGAAAGVVPFGCRTPGMAKDTGDAADSGLDRSTEPAAWDPGGVVDPDRFPFGVQVGDATATTAIVHLRTFSAPVLMVLAEARGEQWVELDRLDGLTPRARFDNAEPAGMAVVVSLVDLEPDTAYSVVFFDGAARSVVSRFRTALAAEGLRRVVFGTTSCLGGNRPWPSLLHAAAEKLDFFGFLGDTVYADGSRTVRDYRAFWDAALATEGMLQLTSSTSLVVTWDDHEVDNNWDLRTLGEVRYAIARGCFDEAFPRMEGPGGSGVWRVLRWGATLDVFVLDGRAERQPDAGLYLSGEQLTWLVDGIRTSTARFKVVFNSVPITDLSAIFSRYGAEDRWDGFPAQRAELLRAIADEQGVLFVTGDVHYAQVGYIDPAGGVAAELMEVFTGPAGSFANVAADLFVGDPQYLWLSSAYNWCRFECDPVAGTIRVTHIGDDGSVLHDIRLAL